MGKYELIILDMDGTLYDLADVAEKGYQIQCDFLKQERGLSQEQVDTLFAQNHIYPQRRPDSASCTEFFEAIGIEKKKWTGYREDHFCFDEINVDTAVRQSVLEKLAHYGTIVLVTSNTIRHVHQVLGRLGISEHLFADILTSDASLIPSPYSKRKAFAWLKEKYDVQDRGMLSIGDRFETDVRPCLENGGDGIVLSYPKGLETVVSDMEKNALKSCGAYTVWQKKETDY
ncbi:MAG: HAD family hydrolase [Bulleidia sp.]